MSDEIAERHAADLRRQAERHAAVFVDIGGECRSHRFRIQRRRIQMDQQRGRLVPAENQNGLILGPTEGGGRVSSEFR